MLTDRGEQLINAQISNSGSIVFSNPDPSGSYPFTNAVPSFYPLGDALEREVFLGFWVEANCF